MKRFIKVLAIVSVSSVYLMQVPCTSVGGGVTILPNIGGQLLAPFKALLST